MALRTISAGLVVCLAPFLLHASDQEPSSPTAAKVFSKLDNDLVDDISRRSFRYFWEQTNARTGLVLDRAYTNGKAEEKTERVASIAATGFGLTAFCIAADHRLIARKRRASGCSLRCVFSPPLRPRSTAGFTITWIPSQASGPGIAKSPPLIRLCSWEEC